MDEDFAWGLFSFLFGLFGIMEARFWAFLLPSVTTAAGVLAEEAQEHIPNTKLTSQHLNLSQTIPEKLYNYEKYITWNSIIFLTYTQKNKQKNVKEKKVCLGTNIAFK